MRTRPETRRHHVALPLRSMRSGVRLRSEGIGLDSTEFPELLRFSGRRTRRSARFGDLVTLKRHFPEVPIYTLYRSFMETALPESPESPVA
jgi:hypothetical protein